MHVAVTLSCPNINHRRQAAPVRFCPECGGSCQRQYEVPIRYQIASGEESGTVRAARAKSSRRFLPHIAIVSTERGDEFRGYTRGE